MIIAVDCDEGSESDEREEIGWSGSIRFESIWSPLTDECGRRFRFVTGYFRSWPGSGGSFPKNVEAIANQERGDLRLSQGLIARSRRAGTQKPTGGGARSFDLGMILHPTDGFTRRPFRYSRRREIPRPRMGSVLIDRVGA